jgi:hypothetical protein
MKEKENKKNLQHSLLEENDSNSEKEIEEI